MSTVIATTVTLIDPSANHRKFYTTYAVDGFSVNQWGRIGTRGQFSSPVNHHGQNAAAWAAKEKIQQQESEGYSNRTEVRFEFTGALTDKESAKALHPLHEAAIAGAAPVTPSPPPLVPSGPPQPAFPDPTPAPAPDPALDPHAAFTARALEAVNLAVTDPAKAMVELAVLREQFTELEKIHRKAASYLSTLDRMLLTAVDA